MGELDTGADAPNVNVTWQEEGEETRVLLTQKKFPCSLCGKGMEIRISAKNKPYCICEECGIQVFFRGKKSIRRLREIINSDLFLCGNESKVDYAVLLFNRIQQVSLQQKALKAKRSLFSSDSDLENAIRAVDNEIKELQGELEKLAVETKRKDK
jgi:DNA-directed RNA polymerase subunit RPC12/RpoP